MDTIVLHVASLYGINVNNTKELLPALFLRAFTEVTGCRVGANKESYDDGLADDDIDMNGNSDNDNRRTSGSSFPKSSRNPINEALDNLTTIFSTTGCIWKAPKLMKLFQQTSEQLITQLTTCTGPWVNGLLGFNESTADPGETPW